MGMETIAFEANDFSPLVSCDLIVDLVYDADDLD